MSTNDIQTALKSLLKKAASDAAFREKALKDPAAALKEAGVELPAGQTVKFVEKVEEVVIPLPPLQGSEAELSEDILDKAAGGAGGENTWYITCSPSHTINNGCGRSVSWIM